MSYNGTEDVVVVVAMMMMMMRRSYCQPRRWFWMALAVLLLILTFGLMGAVTRRWPSSSSSNDKVLLRIEQQQQQQQPTLGLTDLPGYTGWARPEATLAGHFAIIQQQQQQQPYDAMVDQDWSIVVQCQHDTYCSGAHHQQQQQPPWFFVRAYGPAIVTGTVGPAATATTTSTRLPFILWFRVSIGSKWS